MKVGGSPRRNLHARLAEMEAENRKLRSAVREYARVALLDFLLFHGPGNETYWRFWLVADGRHKGRGLITPKQALQLQSLYRDAEGWWINSKTFLTDAEWRTRQEVSP